METLLFRSVAEHAAAMARGDYTAVALTQAYLARICERNGEICAYLCVDADGALAAARDSDARRARGECRGPLDGIPYALKDNLAASGLPMTCGSKILEGYVSPYDATVVARLRAVGAVLLGKTNMDEFAMGSAGEYSAYGIAKNPCDPTRVCGGSSSGSAAAVADGMAVFALGSDTGGSVRQPAAFCGVYGLKPTYGVLSRYGLASMASSLDCVGVLARTAGDCRTVLDAIGGKDARDATSVERADVSTSCVRIGVIDMQGAVSGAVSDAVTHAAEVFGAHGAVLTRVEMRHFREALAAYTVLAATEAASNLSRYDGVRFGRRSADAATLREWYENSRAEGFGAEVRRRILFGVDMLSQENRETFYLRAVRMREAIRRDMVGWMEQYDLLLSPTAPTVAFPIGSTPSPEALRLSDACTVFASLAGLPALAVPQGKDADGLPISVQLTAPLHGENRLLVAAELLTWGGEHNA